MTDSATTNVTTCAACSTRNRVPVTATGTPTCGPCRTASPLIEQAGRLKVVKVNVDIAPGTHRRSASKGSYHRADARWTRSLASDRRTPARTLRTWIDAELTRTIT